jgi:hypothetical protein
MARGNGMSKPKATGKATAPKVRLVFVGDGLLDVPDAGLVGIAVGVPFDVSEDIAQRLLDDATVPVTIITPEGPTAA